MNQDRRQTRKLIWVYPGSLNADLDAATWLETTRHLGELGWDVTLVHIGSPQLTSVAGIPVVSIPMPQTYLVRQVVFHKALLAEIRRHWDDVDIILFHQMSAPWLLPLRYLRAAGRRERPLMLMDTRTAPMIPADIATTRDKARTFYDNSVNRLANHLADGQTAITIRMAEMMQIPSDQLLGVWPSGVSLEKFAAAQTKRDWNDCAQEVRVIYVGALFAARNLMGFCSAVQKANQRGMRIHLDIIGSGPERDDLAAFAATTGGQIKVHPPVAHDEVPDWLAGAHVGVLPFPDQERFRVSSPIKLFEYMASGMPILATHIACHTDVVGDGRYAFWAYDDSVEGLLAALTELWQKRHELPEMGDLAAQAAHEWTWEASAIKLHRALLAALGTPERAGKMLGAKKAAG